VRVDGLVTLQLPTAEDVRNLPLEWAQLDEPWATAVTARAGDGGAVTVTWDEFAESVHVRWVEDDLDRLVSTREPATQVSISGRDGSVFFQVSSRSDGLVGELLIHVGDQVVVTDTLLRG
jgi:hypothetical protein